MSAVRQLAAGEPFCPECDKLTGDGVMPLCTCGRSYDERRADGFRDAVGISFVRWISREEMLEMFPPPKRKKSRRPR
jgi:hypothetical protein